MIDTALSTPPGTWTGTKNPGKLTISGAGWAAAMNGDKPFSGNDNSGLNPGNNGRCAINCSNTGAAYYSFHTAGANFLLADGSVRFFSQQLNPAVAVMYILKNDGITIPAQN